MYDQGEKFQHALADMRFYMQTGAFEKARELQAENRSEIQLGLLYQNAERVMGMLSSHIKQVQARDIEGDEKRKRLDELYAMRNRMAKLIETQSRAIQGSKQ
jgi:hypothetical protein